MQHAQARRLAGTIALILVGFRAASPIGLSGNAVAQQRVGPPRGDAATFNDCHVHLTDYVQEGVSVRALLTTMGSRVQRAALFGVPLQQLWSQRVSGDNAPTYYLNADTPLYYYSFTDAQIAMAYRSLSKEQQARFDPMITGFNPADMYAVEHIKRVLRTFPGVFTGIGEFTIHKEFVSSKVAGPVATLTDPALHRILDFAGEAGLVVILHSDVDMPFPKSGQEPYLVAQMRDLLSKHPGTTVIWAHCGLGRVVQPVAGQLAMLERVLANPELRHVHIDISWDETAKYITGTPETVKAAADLINRYPDRFLFGSDVVAPASIESPLKVYRAYDALWSQLTPEASRMVRLGNYERLFDAARIKVRAWEKANAGKKRG